MLDSRVQASSQYLFGRLGLGLEDPNSLDELLDRSDAGHFHVLLDASVLYFRVL